MKRIFLLGLLLSGGLVVFTQSLSLTYNGTGLEPNQQITKHGTATGGEIIVEVEVTNNGDVPISVKAKKVENSVIPETINTFCWAGMCYGPDTYVSPFATVIQPGQTTAIGEFSGHYDPTGHDGASSISYVFFDENNEDDNVMVEVIYTTLSTGLANPAEEELTFSAPYPNPANGQVNFSYSLGESASLKIYTLIGSLVREVNLDRNSGAIKINTTDLDEGFYFYILSSSDREIKTGRFIVSH